MRAVHIVILSLAFFAIIIGIWFANYYGYIYPADVGAPDNPGTFGDSFGSINALFAGLAFAGIAVSIFIQADQLKVSRKEMIAAQRTLEETKDSIEVQNAATYKQSFETTFFQLSALLNEVCKDFEATYTGVSIKPQPLKKTGRGVFEAYLRLLNDSYITEIENWDLVPYKLSDDAEDERDQETHRHETAFGMAYQEIREQFSDDLSKYYRTLHATMRFIHGSSLTNEEKDFYAEIIRTQMTTDEATMLALDVLSHYSHPDFRTLMDGYNMLINADPRDPLLNVVTQIYYGKAPHELLYKEMLPDLFTATRWINFGDTT